MSGRYFLDTNVVVYMFDQGAVKKRDRARQLVSAGLTTSEGIISSQVIQEFLNVSTRKFAVPLNVEDRGTFLRRVLYPLCKVFTDIELFEASLQIQTETGYSFYDSLIVAAAVRAGCDRLYTEDLQDGRVIRGVQIQNPFETAL